MTTAVQGAPVVEGSAYEVIRARLQEQAKALTERLDALNKKRVEVFGGTEMAVLANERVRTEHACVPVDLLPVGNRLLLGSNALLGLRKETLPHDVFALHHFDRKGDAFDLEPLPWEHDDVAFLRDERFVKDFTELYRYYKDARLVALRIVDGKILAVFQIGLAATDVKVLRWQIVRGGPPQYVDNRGDADHRYPASHSFEWTRVTREDHVAGRHPHVSILDQVFVETTGGDLTIKVENNTTTGQGIWSEPVDDPNQSLDDAQISYAKVGALILLKILPYGEQKTRYLVFHTATKEVRRVDQIGASCVELPEGHGVIFPGGYALSTGDVKVFDPQTLGGDADGLTFTGGVRAPNGEDVLFAFHDAAADRHVVLAYNLIAKEVATPIVCNGWCVFDDGTMAVFRMEGPEPTRVHPLRLWRTPFLGVERAAATGVRPEHQGTMLARVGNAEAVRAISDVVTLKRIIAGQTPTLEVYNELCNHATRLLEAYPWLSDDATGGLATTIGEVRSTATLILDEFQKVQAIQTSSAEALAEAARRQRDLFGEIRPDSWTTIDPFVAMMAQLRAQRGALITLKERRYIDLARIDALENDVKKAFDDLVQRAGKFLAEANALQPYLDRHDAVLKNLGEAAQAKDTSPLLEELEALSTQLALLTEIVGTLKIEDAAQRTKILEDIATVFGSINRARAVVVDKRKSLLASEGAAEFSAQFKLYAQAVESALGLCDTPERTDEQLARLLVQLEELEGRFAEHDSFLPELSRKREEVFEAFTARKQRLLDERQRRCANLADSAKRILDGVRRRALALKDQDQLHALFAADPMVEKARNLADELRALGDGVKSEEVLGLLKAARDEATRQMRDKSELFVEGQDLIQLGKHRFVVHAQPFDLTVLPRGDHLALHISGTDFFEALDDPELSSMKDLWDAALPSEDATVYRGEYLAATILSAAERGDEGLSVAALAADGAVDDVVRKASAARFDEGYERGVHDADAAQILRALLTLRRAAGALAHAPRARALAALAWAHRPDDEAKKLVASKARAVARLVGAFPRSARKGEAARALGDEAVAFLRSRGLVVDDAEAPAIGAVLLDALADGTARFPLSAEGARLVDDLHAFLDREGRRQALADDLAALDGHLGEQFELAHAWLEAFVTDPARARFAPVVAEAAAALCTQGKLPRDVASSASAIVVEGLFGQHPRIANRALEVRLDELLPRLARFHAERVPRFRRFQAARQKAIESAKKRLRLDEVRPRVLSSFVRNKLIQDVYLPLIGDNLAKQMGAAGDKKRTDLMGLLLLISPPGYGKTTLMEYIASRLGLAFVKVNGPALGHDVTSLDPAEAPNATARQEVEKINFAFELAQNAMLYLDDIQHTSPELLQKFISLCDGSRRIEGVWRGTSRTYDLRGKKFCICMAGNPYTESGEKFKVPDMLANRADTYNLGDILGGQQDAFALSFLENALTSNQVLQPLATRPTSDVYLLVRMAMGEEVPTTDLQHGYSGAELDEILRVLRHLDKARKTLLRVNAEYIASASMDDRFRTEPPFKLQGSYRNMNKIAEKIVAVMNDDEVERLVDDHYRSESQTLTTGAEHNLLKLAELRGRISGEQRARWDEIKKGFARVKLLGGREDDPVARVTATLSGVAEHVESVGAALQGAAERADARARQDADRADARARHDAERAERESARAAAGAASVVDALGAVRAAVERGAQSSSLEPAATTIAKELAALKKTVADAARATQSDETGAMLARLDAAIHALSQARVDVNVTAPPPQGVNELVRLQTILIEASLVPLVKGMASSIEHERANAARLEEALAALRALDEKGIVGGAAHASAPVYRPYAPKGTRVDDKK